MAYKQLHDQACSHYFPLTCIGLFSLLTFSYTVNMMLVANEQRIFRYRVNFMFELVLVCSIISESSKMPLICLTP